MPYRQCKKSGCTALVSTNDSSGYCPNHAHIPRENIRAGFDRLKSRQSPEERAFYASRDWTAASRRHRTIEPLCHRCRALNKVVAGVLVHHSPPLRELLATGGNPLSEEHLETLCWNCHQKEL